MKKTFSWRITTGDKMKKRLGFVSNSSTASFIVQIKSEIIDNCLGKKIENLSQTQIDLLLQCGFTPTRHRDPFKNRFIRPQKEQEDFPYLGYHIDCNHDYILQFLVAKNISFKAAVHYSHYLYSYKKNDKYIYILHNYGIAHLENPEEVFDEDENRLFVEENPYERIDKKEFLIDYDEESSLQMMGIEG